VASANGGQGGRLQRLTRAAVAPPITRLDPGQAAVRRAIDRIASVLIHTNPSRTRKNHAARDRPDGEAAP